MTIPSRVLASGVNSMSTVAICGDGGIGLTASGTTQADAYQLNRVYNDITTAASGTGVKLPSTEEGETIYVTNSGANSLKVYPYESTTSVDDGTYLTVNTGCSAIFFAVSRTSWKALQGFNSAVPILHYGSFYDTTTQTAAAINTAYAMTLNSTAEGNGVRIGSPTSHVIIDYTGVYNIQFSVQVDKTSGSTSNIYIWLRKNGTDVPESAGVVSIQGTAARTIAAWNYVISLDTNDYIQMMWSTDSTTVRLLHNTSVSPAPAIPSVILTLTQVNNI